MDSPPLNDKETNLLNRLVPNDCHWLVTDQVPEHFVLYNDEHKLTTKMVDKRLNDFKASRYCARLLLKRLAIEDFPLLSNRHRAPIWPKQIIGSLSHSGTRCFAVVSRSKQLRSIGIDVESSEPMKTELIEQIMTTTEVGRRYKEFSVNDYAKLIFSIKESIYKCLNPVFQQWIGFKDVSVLLYPDGQSFDIVAESSLAESVDINGLKGRWIITDDWIYTCCWLER